MTEKLSLTFNSIIYTPAKKVTYQLKNCRSRKTIEHVQSAVVKARFLDDTGKSYWFFIKDNLLNYYSRKRISNKLIDKFMSDVREERIKFYMDDRDCLVIE